MAKKRPSSSNDISKVTVHLKPVLGLRPGVYLTFLYAFVVVLILFLFLFLPGIAHWGSQVHVVSTPPGAAIYVDGRYEGATPMTVFVPGGIHDLSIQKPFYTTSDEKLTVDGRLFGSLFFPRRRSVAVRMQVADAKGLVAEAFHQFSQWSLVRNIVPNYQIPPILAPTVKGALESAGFNQTDLLKRLLLAAMGDVNNQYLMADFLSAASDLYSNGKVLTPLSLLSSVSAFAKLETQYPNLPFWAVYSLPSAERQSVVKSAWYRAYASDYLRRLTGFVETHNPGGAAPIDIAGIGFVYVPGGRYVMGAPVGAAVKEPSLTTLDIPHIQSVPDFYMMTTEVSHAQYAEFVAQNPNWAPAAIAALEKQGLVTSQYLAGWTNESANDPQAYVSYFAAQAFCAWLTKKLPPSLSGYVVALPTEAEYEWAARMNVNPYKSVFHETTTHVEPVGSGAPNSLGIYDLLGNVWEWNQNWYFPAAYALVSQNGDTSLTDEQVGQGGEAVVRGGSWASSRDSVSYTTRGSQPPSWCTPFLGFRPVIVKK